MADPQESPPGPSERFTIVQVETHADGGYEHSFVPGSVNQQFDDAVADLASLVANKPAGVVCYNMRIHLVAVFDANGGNSNRRAEAAAMVAWIQSLKGQAALATPGRAKRGR